MVRRSSVGQRGHTVISPSAFEGSAAPFSDKPQRWATQAQDHLGQAATLLARRRASVGSRAKAPATSRACIAVSSRLSRP